MTATIKFVVCLMLCSVSISPLTIYDPTPEDETSSCTQIDFNEETLTSLNQCAFFQEFKTKPYDESTKFDPYRPGVNYYLANKWQGLTCGETKRTYSFNNDTELRMAYRAVFESGASLAVRVYDLDRVDSTGKAILVESWSTTSSTESWGFFRERLNKTVNQAQIQIEANMNAGSDLAIEYLTIFNYQVATEECSAIDEFLTTTEVPTTTTERSTTTLPATTSSSSTTTTTTTTAAPTTSSTVLSTETEEITIPSTGVTTTSEATTSEASETTPTTTTTAITTTTTSIPTTTIASTTPTTSTPATTTTSIPITTTTTVIITEFTTTSSSTPTVTTPSTTTNAPRDDTSMLPTSSTTVQQTSTAVDAVDGSSQSTTTATSVPGPISPAGVDLVDTNQWMWMTLAAMFGTLLLLATSAVFYLSFVNQHLDRVIMNLLEELSYQQDKEKPLSIIY